ncbi:GNAT family N-acetyltransferase [Brachybacterium massiliense]|uniref:GNAT family N-acetyltransferase n=1 Tax=Brachybacterium massiliense TaxID=1755098 RepID=UPI001FE84671|nr:GNAT family N-acetyltransferase [Brachybacterium massiliense]
MKTQDAAIFTSPRGGDLAGLAIADTTTDAFAGSLALFDVSDESAEVAFWIHPAYRGSGVAATALALAARFARASGLHELTARALSENSASQRTLTAAGFVFQRQTLDTAPSGERVQLLHYSYRRHTAGKGRGRR